MILGICGLIGSGKGTVADILERDHGFKKVSFADSLKDCVAAVFGWQRQLLEGDTAESRAWREETDHWWANKLGMPNLTPRWVLQYWGTEVCRVGFHSDIWVLSLQNKLRREPDANWVIPDTRFANEIDIIRGLEGHVWRVKRGSDPSWFENYVNHGQEPQGIHESEWRWARSKFDSIIFNDSTLDDLKHSVDTTLGAYVKYQPA